MQKAPISVVLLNWNGENFLDKFLPSIIKYSDPELADIVVVDNASTDNSIKIIKKYKTVKIVQLDKNYGFTGGYNKGLEHIHSKYFLLLNTDVEVTENWLEPMYDLMEKNPNIAACGPKLLDFYKRNKFEYAGAAGGFLDKCGYPFCRGRIFNTLEEDMGQYDSNIDCIWVSGAAFMIRSDLFFYAGKFDDNFFAHQEEVDLCWRLKNLGYDIVFEPKSVVYHVGGGTLHKSNPRKTFLNFRNNLFIIWKNVPKTTRRKILFVRIFMDGVASIKMLLSFEFFDFLAVYAAYYAFWKKRRNIKGMNRRIALKYQKGIYHKSIVFSYFLKKKKYFTEL